MPDRRSRGRLALLRANWGLVVALLAAFVVLACLSRLSSQFSTWDRHITDTFVAWRSPALTRAFWLFTLLGDDPLMASLAASLVCLLVIWGRRARAAAVAAALAGAWALMHVAKVAVGRVRPPQSLALIETPASHSMPSGHAIISVAFFGMLAYLVWAWMDGRGATRLGGRGGPGSWIAEAVATLIGAAFAVLIGLSRVYLGVHWFSDVVAGWCLGGAVLIVAVRVAGRWRRSHGPREMLRKVEPWRGPRSRLTVVGAAFVVVCAVAAVTAWADPLL